MSSSVSRRTFLGGVAATLAAPALRGAGRPTSLVRARPRQDSHAGRIFKAVKIGMIKGDLSFEQRFTMLEELGFDGVEMDSPTNLDLEQAVGLHVLEIGQFRREIVAKPDTVGLPDSGHVEREMADQLRNHRAPQQIVGIELNAAQNR